MGLFGHVIVRWSLTLAREKGQEYYVYRIRSTAENLQQRKLQLLHPSKKSYIRS